MSLRVWLPLNGDLTNNGLSDVTVTNNGATVDNSGKLGKCYYFNGSAQWLQLSDPINIFSGDFSYAVWLKPTDSTRSIIISDFSSGKGSNVAFELTANRNIRLYWNGSPDIYPSNCTLPINEWTHCAIVKTTNQVQFYTNGVLRHTYTGTLTDKTTQAGLRIGDDYRGGTGVSYMGYINDLRIYDHALSPKEVKLLSQGLVCHYKLNRGSGDNILPDTSLCEVRYTYPETSYKDNFYRTTTEIASASQYILSFYAKSTVSGDKVRAHFYNPNTTTKAVTNQGNTTTASDGRIDFTLSDKWEFYWVVWTQSTTTQNKKFIFPRMFSQASGGATGTGVVSVRGVKLEAGDTPTPWKPSKADSYYSYFEYDDKIVYDSSGYNNHCNVITSGLITNPDSPRNNLSTYFNGTAQVSRDSISAETRTISFWLKTTKTNQVCCFADYKSRLGFGFKSDGTIVTTCASFNIKTYSPSAITDNVWHHIGIVKKADDSDVLLYVDGILQSTRSGADSWTHTTDVFTLTCRSYGSPAKMTCYLSDFRLYATALSQEDIQQLYNTPVSVTNTGAMMTQGEFVEVVT